MTDLQFTVLDVVAEKYAATPNLLFKMRLTDSSGEPVHAVALRCQIRIEPQRRQYTDAEREVLADLFGTFERWGETLKPFLWTHATAMVKGFTGSIDFDLPVLCTYDFEVSAAKYMHGIAAGEIPLVLLFSGTVFTRGINGFGVEQVPWHHEADVRLPVSVWRDLMDQYFPGGGWMRLDRDTLDALIRFKSSHALATWEQAIQMLIAKSLEPVTGPLP